MRSMFMRFPGGKAKTLTLSYDDSIESDGRLIDLMTKFKVSGTFNLVPGWFRKPGDEIEDETYILVTKEKALEIYGDNKFVEVANHGYTHKFMTNISSAENAKEMVYCREALEKLFDRQVRGMAYPYGLYDKKLEDVLEIVGIDYSRTVCSSHGFCIPDDFLEWHPTCHHDDEKLDELTLEFLETKPDREPMLFYVWGHTFEFERNDNWDRIEKFLEVISGKDDVWYATNGEICDYVKAFNSLQVSIDGKKIYNPTKITLWVEIDEKIYEIKDELILD